MKVKTSVTRNPRILILGLSTLVSGTGNWITMMAVLAMVVFRGTGGILESSAIFLAGLLPMLASSPAAGWLADRYDRKKLMIVSESVAGLSVVGLVFTAEPVLIYGMLALQAVFISLMIPARQAALPDLVAEHELTQANAFFQQLNGVVKIIAPMLAGFILTVLTPHQAILLDVLSFAASALILTRLPALHPQAIENPSGEEKPAPEAAQAGSALRMAFHLAPSLKWLFISIFLGITVIMGLDVLASVFIRDVLAETEQFYGIMVGLIGVGTFAATLILMFRRKAANPWHDLVAGIFLLSGIPAVMVVSAMWAPNADLARTLVLAGSLLGGVGNGLLTVQMNTLLQTLSPRGLLGRLVGLYETTAVAGQLVSVLLVPALVPGLMTMPLFLGVSSGMLVVVGTLILLKSRSLRDPREMPAAKAAHSLSQIG